jgi:hypothetical protein
MRKLIGLAALLLLAIPGGFAKAATTANSAGTIVIVFKDGHRQSFNLAEIARVEFGAPAASAVEKDNPGLPSRARYLGRWEVGEGSMDNPHFFITLHDNGDARRSIGEPRGHWEYVNGEAQIRWDDGEWLDCIRKVDGQYKKVSFKAGKSFQDTPDVVSNAKKSGPDPI